MRQTGPVFRHDLHAGLRRLGVSRGATLLVHASMSAIAHPQTSFAAIGPRARELMAGHELESQLGEASPLRKLAEDRHAHVLLLGVGFDKCTAFHLAEYRLPHVTMRDNYCVVAGPNGRRQWQRYRTVRLDDRDFAGLGHDFEDGNPAVAAGHLGDAKTRRFPVGAAVDFALKWFMSKRQPVTP